MAGEQATPHLRPFIDGWRLVKAPAKQERRRVVLQHIVQSTFKPGEHYTEAEVTDRLRAWCDGGETDHVAVRRYLIDMGLMKRADGTYWVSSATAPARNAAEQYVTALGLD
jgi:hypothetical protein